MPNIINDVGTRWENASDAQKRRRKFDMPDSDDKGMIQVPAIFTGFSSRADGGASLRFATNELSDVDFAQLKKHHNAFGFVLFKPNEFRPEDIPDKDAEDDDTKSPSTRLRNVFFVYWQQHKKNATDFNTYYRREMGKIIEVVKQKLE
jgi:hypothetical protein